MRGVKVGIELTLCITKKKKKMKKVIFFAVLNVIVASTFAQSQIELPKELKEYNNSSQVVMNMVGDTISFDFVKFDSDKSAYVKYNPGKLNTIYSVDTIWKRKVKNRSNAKLNKHYTIVKDYKQADEIGKSKFKILYIKNRNKNGNKTLSNLLDLSDYEQYLSSDYIDFYLLDITNKDTLIWSYIQDIQERENNPHFLIRIDKIARLLNTFYTEKKMYLYAGYKYGESKYSAKSDYRNYTPLKCIKSDYIFDGYYLIGVNYIFVFSDETGKEYHFLLDDLNDKNKMITSTEYDEIKKSTIQSLKQKGRYHYILSKIEKPKNSSIRYGEYQEIKTDDNVSKFLYEDNILSILWYGDKNQFVFSLKNKSNHSLKIIWDEAAFINNQNESSRVIHKGIRYIDANKSQASTIIPKGTELNDIIAPVDRIRFSDEYYLLEMVEGSFRYDPALEGKQVKVLLPIEIQGVTNEYIFTFDMFWKYDYPKLQ